MRILLVDDPVAKFPNLALMKLSAYHKELKHTVGFDITNPDIIYFSCIFSRGKDIMEGKIQFLSSMYPDAKIELGGYGFNKNTLPRYTEHQMPDYELYDIDYSVGFTSRGCIRNCKFCIVPKNEGFIHDHAPISEFLHPDHNKLILLDNNFLASPRWKYNIKYIIDHKITVNFNQGLDLRLINNENAKLLSQVKFSTWSFKSKYLHFAFDNIKLESTIRKGIETLRLNGVKPYRLIVYILCGFNSTHEDDMHRFNVLRELGCNPYIMKYNDRKDDKWLNAFDRWVNGFVYKKASWKDYDYNPEKI